MPTVYSPPVPTYVALATITTSGGESGITFSSIPSSYQDLVMVINGTISTGGLIYCYFNGDTTQTNYKHIAMFGTGSAEPFETRDDARIGWLDETDVSSVIISIMDYSDSNKYTTALARTNRINNYVYANGNRWTNTNSVTSITLDPYTTQTFNASTTISLYGIEA